MVKAMRGSGGASSLVIGLATAVLTVALPSSGGTRWASVPILAGVRPLVGTIGAGPASATPVTRPIGGSWVATTTSDRFVRLEDLRPDGRRQDERHLRKREWYRHWDNRLDFWDPGHGRKVFVG